jgi:hypothetical protein
MNPERKRPLGRSGLDRRIRVILKCMVRKLNGEGGGILASFIWLSMETLGGSL